MRVRSGTDVWFLWAARKLFSLDRAGLGAHDCMLVHVIVRIRVPLCNCRERERVTLAACLGDAMDWSDRPLARLHAVRLPRGAIALAAMVCVWVVLQPSGAEAFGHCRKAGWRKAQGRGRRRKERETSGRRRTA